MVIVKRCPGPHKQAWSFNVSAQDPTGRSGLLTSVSRTPQADVNPECLYLGSKGRYDLLMSKPKNSPANVVS